MKNLTLLLLLFPFVVLAQHKALPPPPAPTKEQIAWDKRHYRCFNTSKYDAKQRRAFFPFNSAATVKLISFSQDETPYKAVALNNFSVDNTKVKESKVLSTKGIDSLTDILYNVGLTPMKKRVLRKGEVEELDLVDPGAACYNPRNAILFIDANGKVTQYIELCFECERYYFSSSKIRNFLYCNQKYELLKSYFLSQGINYGTVLPKRD